MKSRILLLGFAVWLFGSLANADFIIEFKDTTITPGGTGSIDVMISSNNSDLLGRFSAKFQITTVNDPNGVLEFRSSAEQSNSERSLSNYVFSGNTDATGFFSTRDGIDKQILTQSDRTGITNDINVVIGSTPVLLARLELVHTSPVASNAEYRLSLVNVGTAFRLRDNSASAALTASSFSNFGTINISAVPEPSSSLLVGLALAASGFYRVSRRRFDTP